MFKNSNVLRQRAQLAARLEILVMRQPAVIHGNPLSKPIGAMLPPAADLAPAGGNGVAASSAAAHGLS